MVMGVAQVRLVESCEKPHIVIVNWSDLNGQHSGSEVSRCASSHSWKAKTRIGNGLRKSSIMRKAA
jgi:hypothetical protein